MKIITDSNVIVAAFSSHGLCKSLFEFLIENHTIVISEYILQEVDRIFIKKFKMPKDKVDEIILFLRETALISDYSIPFKQISRDVNDDPILGICEKQNVDYILTGDKDLLVLKKYKNVRIVSPREIWSIFKK